MWIADERNELINFSQSLFGYKLQRIFDNILIFLFFVVLNRNKFDLHASKKVARYLFGHISSFTFQILSLKKGARETSTSRNDSQSCVTIPAAHV